MISNLLYGHANLPQGPIPFQTPIHLANSFLLWIVAMMDEYRDIRLLWTVVESLLMILIIVLVVFFICRVRAAEHCLKEKYKKMDERVRRIHELHEQMNSLEDRD